jgi:hypothetical protein
LEGSGKLGEAEIKCDTSAALLGDNIDTVKKNTDTLIDVSKNATLGGWIILRWILERWDGVMWTGLVWLRIGTGGGLL